MPSYRPRSSVASISTHTPGSSRTLSGSSASGMVKRLELATSCQRRVLES